MRREHVTLVMLASAEGKTFTPVQIQKAVFLLTREAPELFSEGPGYNFRPYDYGPFDSSVYDDIDASIRQGEAEIIYGRPRLYRATESGVNRANDLIEGLDPKDVEYIESVSQFVRSRSFSDLVSSIYRQYPEMRANSIFVRP